MKKLQKNIKVSNNIKYIPLLRMGAVLSALLFLLPMSSFATHMVGGSLSYRCLGGHEYEVTLKVYRDCFNGADDAEFDNPASIGIFELGVNTFRGELKIPFISDDTLSNDLNQECLFVPSDVCVHTTTYKDTVTLQPSQVGYKLVYQRCCRNQTINNIIEPDQTGATYSIDLIPEAMSSCNTSPTFNFFPPVFICVNNAIDFDHSASDPDPEGDSLVYKLCVPLSGATEDHPRPQPPNFPPYDPVIYQQGFGLTNLLGGQGMPNNQALRINPQTGRLRGFPTVQGQFVVGVCVEEYRNGVKFSETRRDFQYNVGLCEEVVAEVIAPDAQCDNLTVDFQNVSSQADEFIWFFDYPNDDPAFTSTALDPTFTYPDTGLYTVALIAEPNTECVDTLFKDIFLQNNSLTAAMLIETFDCLDSSVVALTDASTDPISPPNMWLWELTYDGITLTANTQNTLFSVPLGTSGTVTLTVTSTNGCVQTLSEPFQTGQDNPGADIPDNVSVCIGNSVALNPTIDSLTSYNFVWTPAEGLDDPNSHNPMANPTETMVYTVTISPANNVCSFSKTVTVNVTDLPEAAFEVGTLSCDGFTFTFDNQSQNADDFIWYFGDENNSSTEEHPTFTFDTIGTYTVTLIADNMGNCPDTLMKTVEAGTRVLEADIDIDFATCMADSVLVTFLDASINTTDNTSTWDWIFSNGATSNEPNPSYTLAFGQTITATLTITTADNCTDTVEETFSIESISTDLSDVLEICIGESIALNPNGNTDLVYEWSPTESLDDPNAVNPIASPTETTIYTVNISPANDDCTFTQTVTVNVNQLPQAAFDVGALSCDGLTLTFDNQSQNADSFIWNFGDDNTISTEENPSFTFPSIGTYTVILIADNPGGCPDTLVQEVEVTDRILEAAIGINFDACMADSVIVTFLDASNNDTDNTSMWNWEFSNGLSSTVQNPTFTVVRGEEVIVTLTITTEDNCTDTVQDTFSIESVSIDLPEDLQVCFGDSAPLNPGGNPRYEYQWSPATGLDDSTSFNPIVTPTETTTYSVTVSNFSSDTCQIEASIIVFVPTPFDLVAIEDVMTCDATTVLTGTSSSADNMYIWTNEVGDTIATEQSVTVDVSGEQTYTLTATGSLGCMMEDMVTVTGGPVDISLPDTTAVCEGEAIDFGLVNLDGNDTLTYSWTPTDLIISGEDTANPVIDDIPGETIFTVVVENQYGCSTTETVLLAVVDTTMMLSFESEVQCNGSTVQFTNTSTNAFGYFWNFGDGTTSTEASPSHDYPAAGTYDVYLTLQYDVSCTDTIFGQITTIDPLLIADFDYDYSMGCADGSVSIQFTDLSTNNFGNDLMYNWDFGNDSTSTEPNPVLVLTESQTLMVTLAITSSNNCQDTTDVVTIEIEVPTIPEIEEEQFICPDASIPLNPNGNTDYTYIWTPATGLNDPTAVNPVASPTETTTYTVTINITSATDTCQVVQDVTVIVGDRVEVTSPADTTTCGEDLMLTATGSDTLNYIWTDSSGNTVGTGMTATVNPDTTEVYTVTVSSAAGCMASDSTTVINNEVNVEVEGGNQISICENQEVVLMANNLDPNDELTCNWTSNGPGVIISGADTPTPTVMGSADGPTTFVLECTNQFECTSTIEVVAAIIDFDIQIPTAIDICAGVPTSISPNANPDFTYQWSPTDCVDDPSSPNPMVTVTTDKTLSVIVSTESSGVLCTTEIMVEVNVPAPIMLSSMKDTVLCEEIELALLASSAVPVTYQWFENDIDMNLEDSMITVTPDLGAITYTVIATDNFGCMEQNNFTVNNFPINVGLDNVMEVCADIDTDITAVNLDNEQVLQYEWTPIDIIQGSTDEETVTINTNMNGTLGVSITNQYGCMSTEEMMFSVIDIASELDASIDQPEIVLSTSATLDAGTSNPDYTYEWTPSEDLDDPNSSSTVTTPLEAGDILYTVTASQGECSASDTVTLRVIEAICQYPNIFFPNSFTPNGDLENDELQVYANDEVIESLELIIYNRWGQKVFESQSKDLKWDGTFNGEQLQPDVFGYYLRIQCINGEELIDKGNVSILK